MSATDSDRTPSEFLADLLRLVAAVSLVAVIIWHPVEAWLRFGLLILVLLLPRLVGMAGPFDAAFCATLLLATWAGVNRWYSEIVWMDEVVHFVTVGAVAAASYLALAILGLISGPQQQPIRARRLSVTLLTVALGLGVAALWEFYEWAANQLPNNTIHVGYTDTITDMALGGLGALVAGLLLARWAAAGRDARRRSSEVTAMR